MEPPSVSVVWPARVCIKCPEAAFRFDALTIHHVRHTFIGHALVGGRILAAVRDAAGRATWASRAADPVGEVRSP